MKDIRNYDLTKHNTFGIKAQCDRFIEFDSINELQELACRLSTYDGKILLLGGGSNLLLTGDYNGIVLHSAIRGIETLPTDDGILLRVGSGEIWDELVDFCIAHDWYGVENLSLIPGEVGASAVQNIGAYGVEVKNFIYKVEAVELGTGRCVSFDNSDCEYSYRESRFKRDWRDRYVITHVTYHLCKKFTPRLDYGNIRAELERRGIITTPTALQLREVIIDIRKAKLPDPAMEGNAGSFFMNPVISREVYEDLAVRYDGIPHYTIDDYCEKIPAGWLIEMCGWKGRGIGRAAVHSKQALVIVNKGGATGLEIVALCDAIRESVRRKFGIEIIPEVNIR